MNLLIDFITINIKSGAGEYARYFIMELVRMKNEGHIPNVNLYALHDSSKPIAYMDLQENNHIAVCPINYINIADSSIVDVVKRYNIDKFFITCAQFLGCYKGIENLKCEVICVIHDLLDQELLTNHIDEYVDLIREHTQVITYNKNLKTQIKNFRVTFGLVKRIFKNRLNISSNQVIDRLNPLIKLIQTNNKSNIVVVSEYTRNSLLYNFDIDKDSINVFYSPERLYDKVIDEVSDESLRYIIESKKKYYLLVSANRTLKNPDKVVRAFRRYVKSHPDKYLITIGYPNKLGENIINLNFLSDNDLSHAYKNCYALIYPSFFEGFGYPPIEAMHYGKPVLCTNSTSVPEILEDAPIYFSPLYETGIYQALQTLSDENYDKYCELSKMQYQKIRNRQLDDAAKLLNILTKDKTKTN